MSERAARSFAGVAVAAGALFPLAIVLRAWIVNGALGFPLDDPWIHLTFARNLWEHHSFAYFPGDASTSGSTAPLYTLILALGYAFTDSEKILSYALGIAFQVGFLAVLAAWAQERLGDRGLAAVVVCVVGLDPRIGMLAVSGMETSLFLLLVASAFLANVRKRPLAEGLAAGLAVWVRPDGLVLLAVLAVDRLLGDRRAMVRAFAPAGALVAVYLGFNAWVGGAALPNTFSAKTAFYATNSRWDFLRDDVLSLFTAGAWWILFPLALAGLVLETRRLAGRREGSLRAEAGWLAALILAYLVLLPYGHRFARYLIPVLPAAAILGAFAFGRLRGRLPRGIGGAVLLVVVGLQLHAAVGAAEEYARLCRYHQVRHERTGLWLADHTPASAVIATHDVGAIAYYSERRIVDIVGVVRPEVTSHLNREDYLSFLEGLFEREGVTHLALFRNWLEVANRAPVFVADPEWELMEVHLWEPGDTHLVPRGATALVDRAVDRMKGGDLEAALSDLEEAVERDPESSRSWLVYGTALETSRRLAESARAYRRALALHPSLHDARFRLAVVLIALERRDEAGPVLERLLRERPDYPGARELQGLL